MTPSSETNSVTTTLPMVLPPSLGRPGPAPAVTVYTNGTDRNRQSHQTFFQLCSAATASTSTNWSV